MKLYYVGCNDHDDSGDGILFFTNKKEATQQYKEWVKLSKTKDNFTVDEVEVIHPQNKRELIRLLNQIV